MQAILDGEFHTDAQLAAAVGLSRPTVNKLRHTADFTAEVDRLMQSRTAAQVHRLQSFATEALENVHRAVMDGSLKMSLAVLDRAAIRVPQPPPTPPSDPPAPGIDREALAELLRTALASYPEAMAAVAAGLQELDAQNDKP